MELSLAELKDLPSPFYRVAAKAIIFDDQHRMLVVISKDDHPEVPGGGWEHGETFEQCLTREIKEELGVAVATISAPWFTYSSQTNRGWHSLRITARVTLVSHDFHVGDDMKEARFVSKAELENLEYPSNGDPTIKQYSNIIWS